MVQREQWDTYWGPKKIIFLIRDIDDATTAAAPAESCRFVVLRSPRGRLGSGVGMCNRLRRVRGRFPRRDTSAKMHLKPDVYSTKCQSFRSRPLWGAPSTGACGAGDYPTLDLSPRESESRSTSEKVNNLGPMAPRSRQKRQLPEAPQES